MSDRQTAASGHALQKEAECRSAKFVWKSVRIAVSPPSAARTVANFRWGDSKLQTSEASQNGASQSAAGGSFDDAAEMSEPGELVGLGRPRADNLQSRQARRAAQKGAAQIRARHDNSTYHFKCGDHVRNAFAAARRSDPRRIRQNSCRKAFRTIRGLLSVHAGPAAHAQVRRVLELHLLNYSYSQLTTVAIVSICSPV